MSKIQLFIKQLQWKIILIRILINGGALLLVALLIPQIYFTNRTITALLLTAIGLGILNAIVKPIVLLLTGQLIFATFGLLVILVNALMIYLLGWLFPNIFEVNSFLWAVVGGAVLGLVSNALENLFGLTPPIVPEGNFELRRRIENEKQASLAKLVVKQETVIKHNGETQSVSELVAAEAALEVLQVEIPPATPTAADHPAPSDAAPIQAIDAPIDDKTEPTAQGGTA
jgi:putative membrane protein